MSTNKTLFITTADMGNLPEGTILEAIDDSRLIFQIKGTTKVVAFANAIYIKKIQTIDVAPRLDLAKANAEHISQEAKKFAGLNKRVQNEPNEAQEIRKGFAEAFDTFVKNSEIMDGRLRSIAITHLETSLMFAVKAVYEGTNNT